MKLFLLLALSFSLLQAKGDVIYKKDIAKLVDKETAFDVAKIKKMYIEIAIDKKIADKLEKDKDARSMQKLADAAQKSVKLTAKTVGTLFDEYEKEAKVHLEKNDEAKAKQVFKDFEKQANKLIDKIEKKALDDMEDEWKKIQKIHKQYGKYKLNAGIDLTAKIGGFISKVARAVVSSGTDISAILGGVKDLYNIYKDVRKLADSAEDVHEKNEKILVKLQKRMETKSSSALKQTAKDKVKEKAKKAIVSLIEDGVDDLSKSNDLFENKLLGLEVKADSVSKKVVKLLDKVEKQKSDLTGEQLASIEALTDLSLKKVDSLNDRIQIGLTNHENMKKSIADLKAITPEGPLSGLQALYDKYSKQIGVATKVLSGADKVLGLVSSDYKELSDSAKSTMKILK